MLSYFFYFMYCVIDNNEFDFLNCKILLMFNICIGLSVTLKNVLL